MRKADKASLARHLTSDLVCSDLPQSLSFVIDGGYLLPRVKWTKGCTYGDVVNQYLGYLNNRFHQGTIIVFDGYDRGPSTKDHEHSRRLMNVKVVAPDIIFDEAMKVVFD